MKPLIEVTQTTLGSSLTTEDIENLPTQGREMLSLMQMIPGMTPQLDAGNFEGPPTARAARARAICSWWMASTARTIAGRSPGHDDD